MPLLKRGKKLLHVASRGLEKMGEKLREKNRWFRLSIPFTKKVLAVDQRKSLDS